MVHICISFTSIYIFPVLHLHLLQFIDNCMIRLVGCHVFKNKDDAIKLIKENKGGRFKAFSTRSEAEEFSMNVCGTNCLAHAADMV